MLAMTQRCRVAVAAIARSEHLVLASLLSINGLMGVIEAVSGLLAQSTGLLADSLDMFADAAVYGIALYVVGKDLRSKTHAALFSGIFQVLLGGLVVADVLRRFISGGEPMSLVMFGVALLALFANTACLALIARHRYGEVHMRASWIFSANDALANLGVMAAAVAVHLTGSHLPDLIIGLIIAALVIYGGLRIVFDARGSYRQLDGTAETADPCRWMD